MVLLSADGYRAALSALPGRATPGRPAAGPGPWDVVMTEDVSDGFAAVRGGSVQRPGRFDQFVPAPTPLPRAGLLLRSRRFSSIKAREVRNPR